MDTESGWVSNVGFTPGRGDGLLTMDLWSGDPNDRRERRAAMLATTDPGSRLTFGGRRVTLAELLALLAAHPVRVVLHPLSDRYGVSLQAEFFKRDDK